LDILKKLFPRPEPVAGPQQPSLKPLDDLMTRFMKEHSIPGAALALTRNSCLVYARGYGHADLDKKTLVEPTSLFRIASLSKPITACAVLQLAERGQLKLGDAALDFLADFLPGKNQIDPRLYKVTVLHLLQHQAGFDSEKSFDPMFRLTQIAGELGVSSPAGQQHVIRYMMSRPLDFEPGLRYAYSNFGYCLLGRIIEKISGQSYEGYVQANVLAPLGIVKMKLGRTLISDKAFKEVHYYDEEGRTGPAIVGPLIGEPVPLPYGTWCFEVMDSHGGWIASAVDLVRFSAALDKTAERKILHPASIKTMFARPQSGGTSSDVYYACGWSVRRVGVAGLNTWHTGALPGTSTLLVRRFDGLNWAVLFNTRSTADGQYLAGVIDGLVHLAVDQVKKFPDPELLDHL
jgi:CubicO group peptidase (beta-lactamase class C family)